MRKKTDLYPKEQSDLIQQIIDILDLDSDNSITLYDLDNDQAKTDKIVALIPEIRKYFSTSKIPNISEPDKAKRPWLSVIKMITKSEYTIYSCGYHQKTGGEKTIHTQRYIFMKK